MADHPNPPVTVAAGRSRRRPTIAALAVSATVAALVVVPVTTARATAPAAATVGQPATGGYIVGWGTPKLQLPASLNGKLVTAISTGWQDNIAVTSDGKVTFWDDGSSTEYPVPDALNGKTVTAVSAGYNFRMALTSDGKVVAWGANDEGQSTVPTSLATKTVTAIAAGASHALALTSDGKITAWGSPISDRIAVPASLGDQTVTAISAATYSNLALTSTGTIVGWGADAMDQAGTIPASLNGKTVTAISSGIWHSLALTSDGQVTAWGRNDSGQATVPAALTGKTVVAISAGAYHSVALTSDGQVVAWGLNDWGQSTVPASLTGQRVVAISSRGGQTMAIVAASAPTITRQPQLAVVPTGQTATLTAEASGDPTPTVQWQKAAAGSDQFTDIAGATVTTYTTAALTTADHGTRYRAVFSNRVGTATSDPVTATINDVAPKVTGQPSAATVVSGQTATLTAMAFGCPAPTVQWRKTGANGAFADIPGATGTTYTTGALSTADSGSRYLAVFTNRSGTASTTAATVTVTATAPAITQQPTAPPVASGGTVSLAARAAGDPAPTVKWQKAVPGSDQFTDVPGATATDYATGALTTGDTGTRYRAVFRNYAGTATTDPATLTVTATGPTITQQPSARSIASGQSTTLTAGASGDPAPTVQWQRAAPGSNQFTDVPAATGTTYSTGILTVADSGSRFRAVFTSGAGTATTDPAAVTVTATAPTVTRQPDNTFRLVGSAAEFTATATGDPTPTVRWQKAAPGSDQFNDIAGATATTVTTGTLSIADNGIRYRAVFTNYLGETTTSPAVLYVDVPTNIPTFDAPNGAIGRPYSFKIPVTGGPVTTYTTSTVPPGLTLDPDGTLRGTPTTPGGRSFAVTVTGNTIAAQVRINIQNPAGISGTAPDGDTGTQYSWGPTLTGSPTVSLADGALPDGVRISSNRLTGVPTRTGQFTFTLKAENGYGTPATLTSTVTIRQVPTITGTPATGTVGIAYRFGFTTTGSPAPTVTVAAGKLPDGLTMDPSGTVTGTPTTPGTVTFTVTAGNGAGQTASRQVSIAISSIPVISGTPPTGTVGAAYTYAFTVGGSPAPTVSKSMGTLPPGLTLSGAGVLSGTPTQAGTYTFTAIASSQGFTAAQPVTLTVGTAPGIGADAPGGTLGTAYGYSFPITGSGPITITGTGLPEGLSLSGTGNLSGTPTRAGTYGVTVTATNQFGTITKTQQLTVTPATTGQAVITGPPASVQPGAWESDTEIRIFAEQVNQTLSSDLTVGGVTIPAGTRVNSYYVHADATGDANTAHLFTGSATFGGTVLAVASTTGDLQSTTSRFGLPGTSYSTSTDQGLEYNDTVTVTGGGKVGIALNVYNTSDAVRVITLAP